MIKFKNEEPKFVGETFDIYTQSTYHDDYDYALSFHDGKVVETLISTTAGGTGLEKFEVDITEENEKLLKQYYHRKEVENKWFKRHFLIKDARVMNITYHEAKKLNETLDIDQYTAIYMLLKTKRFRSVFRQSLANQVREWLKDDLPRFDKPLSEKQFSYIIR